MMLFLQFFDISMSPNYNVLDSKHTLLYCKMDGHVLCIECTYACVYLVCNTHINTQFIYNSLCITIITISMIVVT